MNASYKIVLLGAFVLFAAVVGYYIFSGDGDLPDELALNDDYPDHPQNEQIEPAPATEPDTTRPTLAAAPIEEEPVIEQETIGQSIEDLPDVPVIESLPGDESLASGGRTGGGSRPAPAPTEDRTTEDPATPAEETVEPRELERPAPEPDTSDPTPDTAAPEREPEPDPSSRPIPPAPGTIPRTYTVQEGDTFASIAKTFYGEERAWFDIAQANPSVDPKRLQVDQVIVLPNRDKKVREREEVRPPAPGKDQSYTVQPGDNLSKIAKKFYGDSEKWELIYARNRKLIGPRPDALKVDMKIVIPQAYEGAE